MMEYLNNGPTAAMPGISVDELGVSESTFRQMFAIRQCTLNDEEKEKNKPFRA